MAAPIRALLSVPLASAGGGITHLRHVLPQLFTQRDFRWSVVGSSTLINSLDLDGFDIDLFARPIRSYRERLICELEEVPQIARHMRADVVFAPLGVTVPVLAERLVWIPHNVAPYSDRFLRSCRSDRLLRLQALRWSHVLAARTAACTLCLSHHGRRQLAALAGIPKVRMPMAYHGASEYPVSNSELENRIVESLSLDVPFLLSVAHAYEYKNIVELVEAFAIVVARYRHPLKLVLAGAWPEQEYENRVKQVIAKHNLTNRICVTGPVGGRELAVLSTRAMLVVQTSWLENCPITLLEQLASGCAVICSSDPPMPEHAGDAAIYVNVDDPVSIATAVLRLLDDEALLQELKRRARERARMFPWSETIAQTLAALRSVAAETAICAA